MKKRICDVNHKDARNPNSILSGSEYLVRLRSHKMDNNAFCRNMLNLVCFFDIRTLLKRSRQIRFFVIYPEFKEFLGKMKILEPFLKFWILFFKISYILETFGKLLVIIFKEGGKL